MPFAYTLRLLSYVCAIADEGSITAAADRLTISQPSLTRQVRDLERRLGVALLDRTPRGVTLTAAGDVFVARAADILRSVDNLDAEVRAVARGHAGRLRIGFVGSAINGPLGPAIARLRSELPEVELQLRESFDDMSLMAEIKAGDLDLAVHRLPIRAPELLSIPWAQEPLSVFLPDNSPLAADTGPLASEALRNLNLVMWPRESAPQAYDEVMAIYQDLGAVPHCVATAHTVQAILALVAARVGAALMAQSYRSLRRVGVRARPLADYHVTHFITIANGNRSAVLERCLAILQRHQARHLTASATSPSWKPPTM
ncbi:LysR substrate-binding domain-containing protein [Kribbella sp. NBC_01510]|uniref:LysR family transcriptional regulator n=1 Tax=Kribbella sp. NBC_01510 TaxID=2903581 RepID=UPI0038683739